MNKRKIALLAVALMMVAILGFGSTLAYLTDYETATNVFTTGNVDITLNEEFEENSKLIPGIKVTKKVTVTNTGSENAFVRVHIAIPSILDSGDDDKPEFAAYNNTLHFNMSKESIADGLWNWNSNADGANNPGNGSTWNTYDATVDGTKYTVYVVTYETALKPSETTQEPAMKEVYLDAALDNVHIENIIAELGEIKILVAAEAVQEAGFEGKPYYAFEQAMKDINENDDKAWQNLPSNLIEYIYEGKASSSVSADTNANDK